MKTNDLIAALAADQSTGLSTVERSIAIAAMVGAAISFAAFLLSIGWRPDIGEAIGTVRFPFKFVVTLAVVVTAAPVLVRLARPDVAGTRLWMLAVGPALILGGVLLELAVLPASDWAGNLVGSNAAICLTAIPLLSIVPLAMLLWALKRGAPTRPRLTGAICGVLSSSIAATMYALHCDDDSPLFVVVWYSLAMGIVTAVATAVGGRLLRW